MNFGEKLYKLRKEKGLSQEVLAEQIGTTRQAVSKWENIEKRHWIFPCLSSNSVIYNPRTKCKSLMCLKSKTK